MDRQHESIDQQHEIIKEVVDEINKEIKRLQDKRDIMRNMCKHPKIEKNKLTKAFICSCCGKLML